MGADSDEGQASGPPPAGGVPPPGGAPPMVQGHPVAGYPPHAHHYGAAPPQYGSAPPQYGAAPPQYGGAPPQYGAYPYGTPPPPYGAPPYGYPNQGYTTVFVAAAPGQFSRTPFPGLKVEAARVPPQPGQVIIGYETGEAELGCCKCETLNPVGWIFVIMWLLIFWPAVFIVCLLPGFHEIVQRPVFGYPGDAGASVPQPPPLQTTVVIV